MKTQSQMNGKIPFEKLSIAGTVKGEYPRQSAERLPASSNASFRQPMETITDLQSYSLMEERYGIREEGMF